MSSNFKSLMEFNLTKYVDQEYLPFVDDVVRMVLLQFIIQFMYFSKDPSSNAFFTLEFFELTMYIVIAVSVYWLIFKKVIKLT